VERSKSCEMHFYDCAHKVTKATWSTQSRKKFITMIHGIYTAETPGNYEAKRRALFEWAADKPKRAHVKAWFNNFWHVRRCVRVLVLGYCVLEVCIGLDVYNPTIA
jgi:hypothetical protein